jgi:hypothetical protein
VENRHKYKVIVSDRARQMLAGHVRFLAQKSPTAAREVKNFAKDYFDTKHRTDIFVMTIYNIYV